MKEIAVGKLLTHTERLFARIYIVSDPVLSGRSHCDFLFRNRQSDTNWSLIKTKFVIVSLRFFLNENVAPVLEQITILSINLLKTRSRHICHA